MPLIPFIIAWLISIWIASRISAALGFCPRIRGLVFIQPPPFSDFRNGDRLKAEGRLQTPTNSSEFD